MYRAPFNLKSWTCMGLVAMCALAIVVYRPAQVEAAVALSYTASDSQVASLATYTFSSLSFGAAASDRVMVAAVAGGGTSATLNSVTIGGVSATRVAGVDNPNGNVSEIWIAAVPTGTTGDVVVTWAGTRDRAGVSLYRMTGANTTAIDFEVSGSANGLSAGDIITQTIDVVEGGAVVGLSYQGSISAGTWSWVGLTEDIEVQVGGNRSFTTGSLNSVADETGRTVQVTYTADSSTQNATMVTVSWGPAGSITLSKPPNNLGLVGYWPFDEGAGTVATDHSGRGNHGTLLGGTPDWVPGKRGKALDFSSGEYVEIPGLLGTFTSGTISAWVNLDVAVNDGTDAVTIGYSYALRLDQSDVGTVGFYEHATDFNGTWATPNAHIAGTGWHHLVYITDPGNSRQELYIDGVLRASTTFAQAMVVNGTKTRIGKHDNNELHNMDGRIDEVRVYNRALSAVEAVALSKAGTVKVGASTADLQKGTSLESGLVGHWTFDGADTQATITDRSGRGNHGYATATSTMKDIGKLGQALDFNGSSDYVRIPYHSSLQFNSGSFTLAAWIKTSDTNEAMIMARDTTGNPWNGWQFAVSRDNAEIGSIGIWNGDWIWFIVADANVADGQWHHVAATYDGSVFRLYKDGVLLDTSTPISVNYSSTDPMVIGSRLNGAHGWFGHFDGSIDDVRTYNRLLSGSEIQQLYNLGSTRISN